MSLLGTWPRSWYWTTTMSKRPWRARMNRGPHATPHRGEPAEPRRRRPRRQRCSGLTSAVPDRRCGSPAAELAGTDGRPGHRRSVHRDRPRRVPRPGRRAPREAEGAGGALVVGGRQVQRPALESRSAIDISTRSGRSSPSRATSTTTTPAAQRCPSRPGMRRIWPRTRTRCEWRTGTSCPTTASPSTPGRRPSRSPTRRSPAARS
jgi:hypothetical protein